MSKDVERHEALIPLGCQVSSKGRFRNCAGFGPDWIAGGAGAHVWDDPRHRYIDWSCGLGALTLGHGGPIGHTPACLPLPHRVELDLAEMLHAWIPCAEQVRFLKTGTDATSACVRLARVHTGKDIIIDAGNYHGCADWSLAAEHEGVPQCVRDLTKRVPYNDAAAVEELLAKGNVAAVILEPVSLIAPADGYLQRLRGLCTLHGAVLIFDEVITGIRMAKGGAQEVYGVVPDLCAIGKGMANGYPISAVCGKREVMQCWERTHLSGTHFGDPGCMNAALVTMHRLASADFWAHQKHIGTRMLEGTKAAITNAGCDAVAKSVGHPHWWVLQIADPIKQTFVQERMIEGGVLGSNGSHFVSLAHTDAIVDTTLRVYLDAFRALRMAMDLGKVDAGVRGHVNRTLFRRT